MVDHRQWLNNEIRILIDLLTRFYISYISYMSFRSMHAPINDVLCIFFRRICTVTFRIKAALDTSDSQMVFHLWRCYKLVKVYTYSLSFSRIHTFQIFIHPGLSVGKYKILNMYYVCITNISNLNVNKE